MKTPLLLIALATLLALPACEQDKPVPGTAKDGINDALDRRPGENVRDAAEDAADALKNAGKEAKEAVKDATN